MVTTLIKGVLLLTGLFGAIFVFFGFTKLSAMIALFLLLVVLVASSKIAKGFMPNH